MISCPRSRLLENLLMLPHIPGVHMADIPEDSVGSNNEKKVEDEGGEDDKNKRLTENVRDMKVDPENKLE